MRNLSYKLLVERRKSGTMWDITKLLNGISKFRHYIYNVLYMQYIAFILLCFEFSVHFKNEKQ